MLRQYNWTDFKAIAITAKALDLQFRETTERYYVWAMEQITEYATEVEKTATPNADQIDFETNYKSISNVVKSFRFNEEERLLVHSEGDIYEAPDRYQLESQYDADGVQTLYGTDTSLVYHEGKGRLDFIAITGSNSNYLVDILVNGTSRLRITMSDLASEIGLSLSGNVDIWAEVASKNFRYKPTAVGYGTSFEIKVAATQSNQRPVLTYLVLWRDVTE